MAQLEVRILSLHWENIRSFKQLNVPNLNGERPVDLPTAKAIWLQMPNGTGKTTLLHLLRSVFTGKLWSKEGESPRPEKWRRITSLSAKEGEETYSNAPSSFTARLLINGEKWGITMNMNHEDKSHSFITQTPTGKREGWHVPPMFRKTFQNNKRLVELFLFDAETSRQMTGGTNTIMLEKAIRQFGGVSNVYDLVGEPDMGGNFIGGRFGTIADALKKEIGNRASSSGGKIGKWKKGVQRCEKARRELEAEVAKEEKDLETYTTRLAKVKEDIEKIEQEYGTKFEDGKQVTKEIGGLETAVEKATSNLRKELLNPMQTFSQEWGSIVDFHAKHQDGNLPEDVGAGWLLDLSKKDECVCGETMTDSMSARIKEEGGRYLDSNKMHAVSAVQTAYAKYPEPPLNTLTESRDALLDVRARLSQLKTRYEVEFAKFTNEDVQIKKRELADERTELEKDIESCEFVILKRTTDDRPWLRRKGFAAGLISSGVSTDADVVDEIENLGILHEVEQGFQTLLANSEGSNATWNGLVMTRNVVGNALRELVDEMRITISKIATTAWTNMPAAGAEGNLKIELQRNGMKFYRGSQLTDEVSGAQTVSACYSVAKAIAGLGGLSVPLVCDTPFSGMDEDMYGPTHNNITSSFNQSIALINTGEKRLLFDDEMGVWSEGVETLDFQATIYHKDGKADSDGGKLCEYSEDLKLFKDIRGGSYRKNK